MSKGSLRAVQRQAYRETRGEQAPHHGFAEMKRPTRQKRRHLNEEIDVRAIKDICIRFPGDVYILAVWLAMSDRSRSTSTCQSHTFLRGLASKFVYLCANNHPNSLSREDVMAVFRRNGITGNPLLRTEATANKSISLPAFESTVGSLAAPIATINDPIGEPEPL